MSGCFLYFRCWPGFTDPFPFERFNSLSDEELGHDLDSYAREQLGNPEVCTQIEQRRQDRISATRRQAQRVLASRTGSTARLCRITQADRGLPLICRLGRQLGWWRPAIVGISGPGSKVWFYDSPSREFAEALLSELSSRPTLDYDEHMPEYHANPRFGSALSSRFSVGEQATIRRCIGKLAAGKPPPVPYAKLAGFDASHA